MENLFETCTAQVDVEPVVLIDRSGSTQARMKSNQTILNTEGKIIQQILSERDIKQCHLMFWGSNAEHYNNLVSIAEIDKITEKINPSGGTYISIAFEAIPKGWFEGKKQTDIWIVTDGEISDNEYTFAKQVKELNSTYPHTTINIHIVTVEANNADYNLNEIQAGNRLYKIIRSEKLTHYIRDFVSYNNHHHTLPFNNFSNPIMSEGMIAFGSKCFKITHLKRFIAHISGLVQDYSKDDKKLELQRLVYDLSFTLYHLTKSKPTMIRDDLCEMFCRLFSSHPDYASIRVQLVSEVLNHSSGTSNTFQDYQRNRRALFERASDSLQENVRTSIVAKRTNYMTIPVLVDGSWIIYKCGYSSVTEPIILGVDQYQCAGVKITPTTTLPVLSLDMEDPTIRRNTELLFARQCLRQWIRAIYSRVFGKSADDDVILYGFLAQTLVVWLSDGVDEEIKLAYLSASLVMLSRNRYQSHGTMEITHLERGNPPLPVCDDLDKMPSILAEAGRLVGLTGIRPYTLWYGIVLMLNRDVLIKNQYPFCQEDILADFSTQPSDLLAEIKKKVNLVPHKIIDLTGRDYYCYVTLDSTAQTGGWSLPPHNLTETVVCEPKYVICEEAKETLFGQSSVTSCPLCYHQIESNMLIKVEPQQSVLLVESQVFRPDPIPVTIQQNDQTLISAKDVDWNSFPLAWTVPSYWKLIRLSGLDKTRLVVRSEDMWNEELKQRVPFLESINLNGVAIAGGFVRSILLNQPINDIDFFFVGLTIERASERLVELTKDLIRATLPEAVSYLFVHKPNSKVFEILCLGKQEIAVKKTLDNTTSDDLNDMDKDSEEEHEAKDSEDEHGNTDEDNDEVEDEENSSNEETNDEPEYNSSDGQPTIRTSITKDDLKGYKIVHKFQIILVTSPSLEKVFENFDLDASCAGYLDKTLWFAKRGLNAYRYMVNYVRSANYTDQYLYRLSKYLRWGFTLLTDQVVDIKKIRCGENKIAEWDGVIKLHDGHEISENIIGVSGIDTTDNTKSSKHDHTHESHSKELYSGLYNGVSSGKLSYVMRYIERYNTDCDAKMKISYKLINQIDPDLVDCKYFEFNDRVLEISDHY